MAPPAITSGMIISCEIRQIRERRLGTWGKGNIPCNGRGAVLVDVQVLCPPHPQAWAQVFKLQKRVLGCKDD